MSLEFNVFAGNMYVGHLDVVSRGIYVRDYFTSRDGKNMPGVAILRYKKLRLERIRPRTESFNVFGGFFDSLQP